jgi:GNAT superfamily N-acetyltransferase
MDSIRLCRPDEHAAILEIINAAAQKYRGVIPADCWHEPYMPADQLAQQIAAGVVFWGYDSEGVLAGIMGIQAVKDVDLIRHAYVRPAHQNKGIGGKLLAHLHGSTAKRVLIGTWADAAWAIRFYQHHGFELVPAERKAGLLRKYWTISERQIETSVVLESRRSA